MVRERRKNVINPEGIVLYGELIDELHEFVGDLSSETIVVFAPRRTRRRKDGRDSASTLLLRFRRRELGRDARVNSALCLPQN